MHAAGARSTARAQSFLPARPETAAFRRRGAFPSGRVCRAEGSRSGAGRLRGTGLANQTVDGLIDIYRPPFSPANGSGSKIRSGTRRAVGFGWRSKRPCPCCGRWACGGHEEGRRQTDVRDPRTPGPVQPRRSSRRAALGRRARYSTARISILLPVRLARGLGQGADAPAGLDVGVLVERNRAFTWLIEGGGDWDEVVARA